MSKFHSIVSRRDFMKGLGVAGAGIGAASVVAPAFQDLDDAASTAQSVQHKHPWWVKERSYLDSTTEVHWDQMQRFDGKSFNNESAHLTPDNLKKLYAIYTEWKKKTLNGGVGGYTLRDYAFATAARLRPYFYHGGPKAWFLGEAGRMETPTQMGVPRWEGTPEENARMIRSMALFFGASSVNFGEIIEGKTKQLINTSSFDLPNVRIEFEDVDKGYEVDDGKYIPGTAWNKPSQITGKVVIPNSYKNVIVVTTRQPLYLMQGTPGYIQGAGTFKGYDQLEILHWRVKGFLDGIGYQGLSGGSIFGITSARPAWGTLYGLGEFSRMMETITVEEGPVIRATSIVITNLPLPPSNPIDAGINRFCYDCGRCAKACPVGAIYLPREPDFITTPIDATAGVIPPDKLNPTLFNNSAAYKRWPHNQYACRSFWTSNVGSCSICQGTCVFSKFKEGSIHEVVRPIIANTGAFTSFFRTMDETFGYGLLPENKRDDWWDEEHVVPPQPNNNY